MPFLQKHQPGCLLAHDMINKLSAIIGFCDLLQDKAETADAECARRITAIHDLAKSTVKQLLEHQCQLYAAGENSKREATDSCELVHRETPSPLR